jgi:nitric oxide reductase activation protein
MTLARRVAILFDEALKKSNNVNHFFAYDYSSEHRSVSSTDIHILREPGFYHPHNFGSPSAGGYTHEGRAIWNVGNRIRKFTKDPVVLFIISDGLPEGTNYTGMYARRHTKESVMKLRKMGIVCVHIAIDDDAVGSEDMYDIRFDCTGLDDLPQQIGRIMKEVTRKIIKPRFV